MNSRIKQGLGRVSALICITTTLAGCASQMNPIGEAKFDCNRRQDAKSPHCRSFRAVDQATDAPLPQSRYDQAFLISDMDRLTGISPDGDDRSALYEKTKVLQQHLPHQIRNDAPLNGQPVREGPVVQRVWIKRHVDSRDVLTEDTVVYREIKSTRWSGFPTPTAQVGVDSLYPRRPKEERAQPPSRSDPSAPDTGTPDPVTYPEFKQPGNSPEPKSESAFDPSVNGSQSLPK